jgi:hypothetical protein
MTVPNLPHLPMAQNLWERFSQGISDEFQGRRLNAFDVLLGIAVLLGVAAIAWGVAYLRRTREGDRDFRSPRRLFFALCRAHGLRWREQWWLWRLARFQQLGEPARLFLEAERFDPPRLSPALRAREQDLAQLRQRLFAESARKSSPDQPTEGAKRRENVEKTTAGAASVPLSALSAAAPETESAGRVAATPLLPTTAAPTLDLPPWNAAGDAPRKA